ncbi:MAG TPA: transglutaminase-like domain-containing protein [Gemmatimonadales bacterium]|nr:transglutaminase-like domain-containing protein [Gemmatimonadales bacterium]
MSRRLTAIVVLLAWGGALGWLGAREWARRGVVNLTGRQVVSPGAAYYRLTLGDSLVGYGILQVDTLAPTDTSPALVLLQRRLELVAGKAPTQRRYELVTSAWLTTDLRLWRAETRRSDTSGVASWTLRMDHDTLRTVIVAGGDTFPTLLRLDTIPVPVEGVPLWVATYGRPRPGRAVSVPAIDLATLARRRETWTATAESTFTVPDSVAKLGPDRFRVVTLDTVHAWRLSGTDRSVQVHQWVDERGFPLRWWTGGGLALDRAAFEPTIEAYRPVSDSLTGRSPLLPPAPADPAVLATRQGSGRTLLLRGAEYPPLDASGPTQRVAGDTVETFEPRSWRGQQAFRPVAPLPMQDPRFAAELQDEPRLSPDDTALTAQALAIRGSSTNPREAASGVQAWVHANLTITDPARTTGVRPAGAVLASRSGTPEELALLTVALARRMGLPARLAGGVLLTPRGMRAHTWAEVFVGDWVPVDPTQPGFTASPAHLRLVTGGTGGWADLLPLAGALIATGTDPIELP